MSVFGRTFHPDEANQAFATGRLLETGRCEYRPDDHHGTTLYYAAAAVQKAAGRDTLAAMDGTLLRCTPLFFAVLVLVFCAAGLCRLHSSRSARLRAAIPFALVLGTSPLFVFFAADFIHEMLLAAFTAALFWLAARRAADPPPSLLRVFAAGAAAGLAFATKETAVLSFAAAAAAYAVARPSTGFGKRHIAPAAAGFALASVLFFSSFGTNWRGVADAFIVAPVSYAGRAFGAAASDGAADHVHSFRAYLEWMFFSGWRFSALPLAVLFAATFRRRSALHVYTLALFFLYSAIPYKTPWCALQLLVPMALAAFAAPPRRRAAALCVPPVAALAVALNLCGVAAMSRDPDSREIPYNYAAASPEVEALAATAAEALEGGGEDAFLAVALPPADTWPFPWYNRAFEGRTGYWTSFDDLRALAAAGAKPAAVVVPAEEGHLVQPLFPHLKRTARYFMRPGVRVRVFW